MSKREQALEEAVRMRESRGTSVAGDPAHAVFPETLPEFGEGAEIVDLAKVNKHITCITDPHCPAAEEYKRIRTGILKSTSKNFLNTIMFTSSQMGEGKTVTSLNLAVTMAKDIDHTVLLVDADLRSPSVHSYLGLSPKKGLSDYLSGTARLSEVIFRTGIGKLAVLPAGEPPDNPSELLSSEKMRVLITELKHRYKDRYVLFDTPPLLAAAEPLSMARYVDGIVFVIQAARTSPKIAARAVSLMKDFTVFGIVLNNVPSYLSRITHPSYNYRRLEKA
ncbi:MAG TPA: polysaccharide biosynthesis tyrosine autokinase [Dissulfurispiraceae bacterium]|nr:polysaccharide biosynthesis tyrosine autokinase [Dissulfurispiraceae bacterium]